MSASGPRLRRWPFLVVFLVMAFVAFGPGLRGEFLNFDDGLTVLENPAFRAGFPAGLPRLLDPTSAIVDVYLPVSYASLWVDYGLFGAAPLGYHVHSLLIHGLAGFVLFLLMTELGLGRSVAFAGTLPFLLHPALCESVSWVSSRKDVLSGLFVLLALWRGRLACAGRARAWPVVLLAALALYSKATSVVLPVFALGVWRLGNTRLIETRFVKLWAAVTGLAVVAGLHHAFIARQAATTAFTGVASAVPGTFLAYLRTMVWPDPLAVHQPRELLGTYAHAAALKAIGLGILIVAGLVLLRRGRGGLRWVGLGALGAITALIPFNGLLPAFAVASADRYLYLALPGLGLAVAGAIARVPARPRAAVAVAVALAVTSLFGWRTRSRTADFVRSDRLWQADLRIHPHDSVALANLAEWHIRDRRGGGWKQAEPLLEAAAQHAREIVHELRIAGQQLNGALSVGDLDAARGFAEKTVALGDAYGDTRRRIEFRLQLAEVLTRLDLADATKEILDEVLRLDPNNAEAAGRRASLLLARAARAAKTLPLEPRTADLVEAKRLLDAVGVAHTSVHQTVALAEYHRLLGQTTRAAATLAAYRGAPHQEVYLEAARIYESEGLFDEAIRELERGEAERVVSVRLVLQLAALYLKRRRYAEAEALLARVYRDQPDHAGVRRAYGLALTAVARQMVGVRPIKDYAARVRLAQTLLPDSKQLVFLDAVVKAGEAGLHVDRLRAALARAREAEKALPGDTRAARLALELLKRFGFAALLAKTKDEGYAALREYLDRAGPDDDRGAVIEAMRGEFEIRFKKATDALEKRQLVAAGAGFRRALELFPRHDGALLRLGMTLFAAGNYGAAADRLAQSMRGAERRGADPGMALLYRMRSLAHLERKHEAVQLATAYLTESSHAVRDAVIRTRIKRLAEKLRDE